MAGGSYWKCGVGRKKREAERAGKSFIPKGKV
jgi:hypothetical protein